MKKSLLIVAFIATVFSYQSFGQDSTKSISSTLLSSYYGIKDALVKTNGSAAAENAATLLVAINSINMTKLSAEEHTVWMKVSKNLQFNAQHIQENKNPEHQREHFIALSSNMYELIKVLKPAETVYYQYCPMANDGKGANWLSSQSVIKNPYYGSSMLSCGKTVEIINQ